jgi:D-aminopeptidase, domain C.
MRPGIEPESLYRRLVRTGHFADGVLAAYGFGLARSTEFGRATTSHGGALRGWRSHRLHVPSERSPSSSCSITCPTHGPRRSTCSPRAGRRAAEARRRRPRAEMARHLSGAGDRLAVRIAPASAGQIRLRYGHSAEELDLRADGSASNASGTWLSFSDAGLRMGRPQDNQDSRLRPCDGVPSTDVAGRYRCRELDAELTVADTGGVLYGAFSGFLGQGRMEMLDRWGGCLDLALPSRARSHAARRLGPWPSGAVRPGGSRASTSVAGSLAAFPTSA